MEEGWRDGMEDGGREADRMQSCAKSTFSGGKPHGHSYTLDRTKTIGAVGQDLFPVTAEGQGGAQSTKQPHVHMYKQH